jgi:hypothetical protein
VKPYRIVVSSVAISIGLLTLAVAQTTPPSGVTSPSAASSPHQRDATSNQTPEAPANNGSNPAAASSPHQAAVINGSQASQNAKGNDKQTMKGCVAREQAAHSDLSATDANKTCKDQLKSSPPK